MVSLGQVRTTIDEVRSKRVTFLAASIAYYAFVSLIPLIVLALVAAGAIGGRDLALEVASVAGQTLSVSQQGIVDAILENGATAGGVTIVGLLTLVWSSMKIFRGLDVAFSRAYGVAGPDSLVDQITDALVALGAVILAAIATVVVGVLVTLVQADTLLAGVTDLSAGIVGTLSLILALTIALFPLYYFLPAEDVTLREAVPGAVFAAVGWTAMVRSKSAFVAPMVTATPASWIISAASRPKTCRPMTRSVRASTTSFMKTGSSRPDSVARMARNDVS